MNPLVNTLLFTYHSFGNLRLRGETRRVTIAQVSTRVRWSVRPSIRERRVFRARSILGRTLTTRRPGTTCCTRSAPVTQTPLPDGTDDHAFHMKSFYGLTPSTETSVYDFWALARDFCVGDDEVDRFLEKMQRGVVQEDVDALNILLSRADERREVSEVSVKIGKGGLAARRVLAALRDAANLR